MKLDGLKKWSKVAALRKIHLPNATTTNVTIKLTLTMPRELYIQKFQHGDWLQARQLIPNSGES